jgi:hypothetical protein
MARLTVEVTEKGINQTDTKLKKLGQTASKTEKQTDKLEDGFKSFSKNAGAAIAAVDGPLGGISSRVSSLTTLFTTGGFAVTAFATSITAVTAGLTLGITALDEYEVNLKRLDATIRATGEGVGFTAEQLQEQARQLAFATLTSTQEVQKAQAKLVTFNRVLGAEFERTIRLSQDLAEAGFGDIIGNANQLGKALQDPIAGLSSLTEVGVTFSSVQKRQIDDAIRANDVFEAQRIILDGVASQVEGVAAAVASGTLTGSIDTLGQSFTELAIEAARASGAMEVVVDVIDQISKGMQVARETIVETTTAATLFDEALQKTFELRGAESFLGTLEKNSAEYNTQIALIARLKVEQSELQSASKAAAEKENAARKAAGDAQIKELERRKAVEKELRNEQSAALEEERQKQALIDDTAFATDIEARRKHYEEQTELFNTYRTGINTIEAEQSAIQAEIMRENMALANASIQSAGNALSSSLSSGIVALANGSKDAKDVMLDVVNAVATSVIQAGIDILVQKTITDNIAKALLVTQTTSDVARGVSLASLNAFASTAAIPVVGLAAAPAAAAAAAASASAIGAPAIAAAGARFQGGMGSAGTAYKFNERGDEAYVPKVDGKFISANDLKSSVGNGVGGNVYITNNTPAKVEATQDKEGNTYVTIEELDSLIGASLSNPNSEGYQGLSSVASLQRS